MKRHVEARESFEEACKLGFEAVEWQRMEFEDSIGNDLHTNHNNLAEALHEYSISLRWCGRVGEADEVEKESIESQRRT